MIARIEKSRNVTIFVLDACVGALRGQLGRSRCGRGRPGPRPDPVLVPYA